MCMCITIYCDIYEEIGSGFSRSWVYARVYSIIMLYLYLYNVGRERRERSIVVVWPSRLTGREKVKERTIIFRVAETVSYPLSSSFRVHVVQRRRWKFDFFPRHLFIVYWENIWQRRRYRIYIYIYTYNSEYCRRGPVNYIPPILRSIRAARGASPTT